MAIFNRVKGLFCVSAIALLTLTACGEKRSVQCQKVGDILNASSSQRMSASSTSNSFSEGAEISRKAADDLAALELGDKGVSNLRSHLVANFREMADASTAMNAFAGADGSVTFDSNSSAEVEAVMANFETSGRNFSTTFNALQTYCNGGSAPSELVDTPAS